ncbi:hypothetical protein HZC32_02760 [Candidatus Woesearchaeota archaeon]|nr:hypothetical protein [Candidatus Woesearchaeota archaeon]
MPTLIALLSTGKGTWAEVSRIIQAHNWNRVFLITNKFGEENFRNKRDNTFLVVVDADNSDLLSLTEQIKQQLKPKISDFEVALNLASGSGKEHMALLEAVLELGFNFRVVTVDGSGNLEVLGLRS